jgi:membrane protein implicated in regulation of membrane protease activity
MEDIVRQLGPWLWIIAGLILLGLELLAPGVLLIWFGLAALATGLFAFVTDFWPAPSASSSSSPRHCRVW